MFQKTVVKLGKKRSYINMSDIVWWQDAPKNSSSGGLLRFAKSDSGLYLYSGNYYYWTVGFKCVKEAGLLRSLVSDDYEAYSYHSFIKFNIEPFKPLGSITDAQLHLRIWTDPEGGVSARTNISPDPTNAYLDVWQKKTYDGRFPWNVVTTSDYGWSSWEYCSSSSQSVYSLVGQALSSGGWIAPIDVTSAVNYALSQDWDWVALRFTFGKMNIPWTAPDDWNYFKRPTPYDQECYFTLCGSLYIKIHDSPVGFPEDKYPQGCPWLALTVPSGELPEQEEPGELVPTPINCVDADTEAQMALAGTEGGGLWVTYSGGWYKVYEHDNQITSVYMDYLRNFVHYPDDQISWFGTYDGKIFKSAESLHTWNMMTDFSNVVYDIEGSDLDSNKVAVAVGNSIYTTRNGGITWVLSKTHSKEACNLMVRGDEIQAVFADGDGFRSPNFGSTWYNLTGIPSSSNDVGFDNFNEKRSFVGASGYLYTYDSGTSNFSYTQGAAISGATNQIDVSHRSSIALVGTTETVYKTINFGKDVYELKDIPSKSVAIGGLVPVEWVPRPSDKPDNIFAKIADVSTGYYDMATGYAPRAIYIVRSINGNYYALTERWKLHCSTDGGRTWEMIYQSTPEDLPDPFECRNSKGAVVKCTTYFGGDNVLIDNSGNIHLIWGVYWLKRYWQTSYISSWQGGKYLVQHTILDKDHNFVSETTRATDIVEERERSTDVDVLGSAVDSRGNVAVLYKRRDPRIPHRLVYQKAECIGTKTEPACGFKYGWYSNPGNDPANPKVVFSEAWPEAAKTKKCPNLGCGGTLRTENYWPAYPDGTAYRNGDQVFLDYDNFTYFVWSHKYSPAYGGAILYPQSRVSSNTFDSSNCSIVIDGNDTLHLTYTDPHKGPITKSLGWGNFTNAGETYYVNKEYGEAPLNWYSNPIKVGASGNNYAMVDQHNNIHYTFGNRYRVRFSDGVWSNSELANHSLTGSFSRSWNGTIWQLLSGNARRRMPLSAPIVDVKSNSFIITSPEFNIINYSFEADTAVTGWGAPSVGSASRSSVRAYHGTYSLRLIGTSTTSGAASRGQIKTWAMPERTLIITAMVWCAHAGRAKIVVGDYQPPYVIPQVVSAGENGWGQCDNDYWTNIVQISTGSSNTVGLRSDGTIVMTGYNAEKYNFEGITATQVVSGDLYVAYLKSDGTVGVKYPLVPHLPSVASWENITQISARFSHLVGLRSDGTVIQTVGYEDIEVLTWTDIVQVSAGVEYTVGLKNNGTVVSIGNNEHGQRNVSGWTGITQVAASDYHTVGLKSDGTVVATGLNDYGQCNVGIFSGITQVAAGRCNTAGLKSDGTVVVIGSNESGQCDTDSFPNEFTDIIQIALGGHVSTSYHTEPNYSISTGHTVGMRSMITSVPGNWENVSSEYHPGDSQWHQLTVSTLVREASNQVSIVCRIDEGSNVEAFFDLVTARCINPFYELSKNDRIQVYDSSDNDGVYTVLNYSYNSGNEEVTIKVSENIPSDTADGRIIPISSSVAICGMWDIYKSRSVVDGVKTTLTHSYYPIDYDGIHSSIFADGFAGTVRYNRAVYFWSDPPETKLLKEKNDN